MLDFQQIARILKDRQIKYTNHWENLVELEDAITEVLKTWWGRAKGFSSLNQAITRTTAPLPNTGETQGFAQYFLGDLNL